MIFNFLWKSFRSYLLVSATDERISLLFDDYKKTLMFVLSFMYYHIIVLLVWKRREADVAWYFHSIIDQSGGTAVGVFCSQRKQLFLSKHLPRSVPLCLVKKSVWWKQKFTYLNSPGYVAKLSSKDSPSKEILCGRRGSKWEDCWKF